MSDTGPELMAVSIDYGDGTVEEHIVTDGYTYTYLYADNQVYEVTVTEIVLDLAVDSISPDTAVMGADEPDVTMTVTGTGFSPTSKIYFNGGEENTVRVSSTELTTIVKPSTAQVAGTYPVSVYRSEDEQMSNEVGFTFSEAAPEEPPPEEPPVEPEGQSSDDEFDPNAPDQEWAADAAFDPAAHTVTEVIGYVEDNPDQRDAILELEEQGKNRVTLINHLESM